jgi:predicted nuclease of predicted toxin-antitoxin system
MEARRLTFKLDENLSRHLKAELIALGYDTLTAADEGLLSRPDSEIASAARQEGRLLLTLDLDFADVLRFPPGSHPGIVLLRPATLGPGSVSRFVADLVRSRALEELEGCLVIVEPGRVRVRRPPTP